MELTDIEVYEDSKGEWRWRIRSENNEIIGASSEGFSARSVAEENVYLLADALIAGFTFVHSSR